MLICYFWHEGVVQVSIGISKDGLSIMDMNNPEIDISPRNLFKNDKVSFLHPCICFRSSAFWSCSIFSQESFIFSQPTERQLGGGFWGLNIEIKQETMWWAQREMITMGASPHMWHVQSETSIKTRFSIWVHEALSHVSLKGRVIHLSAAYKRISIIEIGKANMEY